MERILDRGSTPLISTKNRQVSKDACRFLILHLNRIFLRTIYDEAASLMNNNE